MFSLDQDGRLTYANRRCEELLGHGREELLGRYPWEVIDWLFDPAYEDRYRAAMLSQERVSFLVRRPSGEWLGFVLYPDVHGLTGRVFPTGPPDEHDGHGAGGTAARSAFLIPPRAGRRGPRGGALPRGADGERAHRGGDRPAGLPGRLRTAAARLRRPGAGPLRRQRAPYAPAVGVGLPEGLPHSLRRREPGHPPARCRGADLGAPAVLRVAPGSGLGLSGDQDGPHERLVVPAADRLGPPRRLLHPRLRLAPPLHVRGTLRAHRPERPGGAGPGTGAALRRRVRRRPRSAGRPPAAPAAARRGAAHDGPLSSRHPGHGHRRRLVRRDQDRPRSRPRDRGRRGPQCRGGRRDGAAAQCRPRLRGQ
nr:PAS domain-containing protein [Streptomyces sp. GC420]